MTSLTKAEIARRQLGTALALYLDDRDPVSVHCLACGGCEIAEQLVMKAGATPFRKFTMDADPAMTDAGFVAIRNRYWNAFKHSTSRKGVERDDSAIFDEFSETANEERLFVGWMDYGSAAHSLPIEAQVYNAWFMALDRTKFSADESAQEFARQLDREFPGLPELPHDKKKQRLRRAIEKWRKQHRKLPIDSLTDYRSLTLGSVG